MTINNGIIHKIKSLGEAELIKIKELLVIDYCIPNTSVTVHLCIEKTENGNFLITESDIEAPMKSLLIPKELQEFLMVSDIHDWSVLNQLHYHIVSTKALTSKQLLKCIKYFFTINQYFM